MDHHDRRRGPGPLRPGKTSSREKRSRSTQRGPTGIRKNPYPGGNDPFTCLHCGAAVRPLAGGGARNHCPECLWSLHVDRVPGDRAEPCGGLMSPVGLQGSSTKGWKITFRCLRCGAQRQNHTAQDDPRQPDRWDLLVSLSTAPHK